MLETVETAVLVPPFVRVLSIQNESNKKKGLSRKLLEPLPCADTSQDTRETLRVSSIPYFVKSSCPPLKTGVDWIFLDLNTGLFAWFSAVWVTSSTVGPEFRLLLPPF